MSPDQTLRLSNRDRIFVGAIALVGVLTAAPGVHVFQLWLPHGTAFLVSHGIGLVLLGVAWWQWRVRRA